MNISTDNPFLSIPLTLPVLCNLSALAPKGGTIPPEHEPFLIGVEEVRGKGAPDTAPPEAIRYYLTFPGSSFLRISVKVEETAASITQNELNAQGGLVKVRIEGFESGSFLTDGGGARPYFKAKKITPIGSSTATGPKS